MDQDCSGADLPCDPGNSSFTFRGTYGKDTSPSGFDKIVDAGFNMVDVGPYSEYLDAIPGTAKGLVWLGDDDNTTCSWERSDDWTVSHAQPIANHPRVAAYFIADEPHVWECPNAPEDVAARSNLVKSLDQNRPTFVVLQPHSPDNPFIPYVGKADVLGAEKYPCSIKGCVFSKIDETIAQAEAAGVPRYWPVIQAYQDAYYVTPTAAQVEEEFNHWRAALPSGHVDGYVVYAWHSGSFNLEDYPATIAQLKIENGK